MTSTLPITGRERIYDIDLVGADPAALVRILTTLRRRCCTITHVDFDAGNRHRPGRLTVGVEPPPAHGHAVGAWLEGLVDVAAARARE